MESHFVKLPAAAAARYGAWKPPGLMRVVVSTTDHFFA